MSLDCYNTTVFGAYLDQEIADALRYGMAPELLYAELAARTRAMADRINATQAHDAPPSREGGV